VADQPHALDAERVQQCDRVVGHALLDEVLVGRPARPAEAAHVRAQHAEVAPQRCYDVPP
jgi:hypothetical protein